MDETAADLAIIAAIVSSLKNKPINPLCIFLGEVGLSGEVRSVPGIGRRIAEAERLGFNICVVPKSSLSSLKDAKIKLIGIDAVTELFREDIF